MGGCQKRAGGLRRNLGLLVQGAGECVVFEEDHRHCHVMYLPPHLIAALAADELVTSDLRQLRRGHAGYDWYPLCKCRGRGWKQQEEKEEKGLRWGSSSSSSSKGRAGCTVSRLCGSPA